jgi:hypothetical protein
MAIAFDTSVLPASGTASWSHTCTGSNVLLVVATYSLGCYPPSATYGGVTMPIVIGPDQNFGGDSILTVFFLVNATPGTSTVAVSGLSTNVDVGFCCASMSLSGVSQSGFPDSSSITTAIKSTPYTLSTTVVASGCWLLAFGSSFPAGHSGSNNFGDSLNSPQFPSLTIAYGGTVSTLAGAFSTSNGTVSPGSNSVTYTGTTPNNPTQVDTAYVLSIAPAASGSSAGLRFFG